MEWAEAHKAAQYTLAGAERIRLPGASSKELGEIELAGLDWGGEGALVVMHHANGFCAASLGEVASELRKQYRVISIDARGHGDSTPVVAGSHPNAYDWWSLAHDVERATESILERTGHERVELAIGHSFGGALMLAAASLRPKLFARLLLCDPVIFPRLTEEERASAGKGGNPLVKATLRRRDHFPSYAEAFAHCASRGLFENFTPASLALYIGEGMRPTEEGEGEGEVTLKCVREVEAAIFGGGGTLDLTDQVGRLEGDVRILHALQGNFSRSVYDRLAEQMPSARVESVDVGHLFPMEQPELVLSHVAEMMGPASD